MEANSVSNKKTELGIFLHANSIDVVALCETKLPPNKKFNIPGYKVYCSDRTQFGGGVMLLVANGLRHDPFTLPSLTNLEATAIVLQLKNHSQLTCVAAYLPPTAALKPDELDVLFPQRDPVLITGDFNCKHLAWNNSSVNKNGGTLLSYCGNKSVSINYPDQPTHYPYNSYPSVLDLALSHHCATSKPVAVLSLSCDHDPVLFKVYLHPERTTPRRGYDFRHADWPLFRNTLDLALPPQITANSPADLDQATTAFTQAVQSAADRAIPVITTTFNQLTLPSSLTRIMKLKNYCRHHY